jgi:hypothetical protein
VHRKKGVSRKEKVTCPKKEIEGQSQKELFTPQNRQAFPY